MAVSSITRNPATAQLSAMRKQFEDLQRQLGTEQRSETYGGLGADRSLSISFRARVSSIESYTATSDMLSLRVKLLDSSLNRLSEVPTDIRAALDPNAYEVRLDGKTDAQKTARIALDEVIGLLNSEADGRYLFAGKATSTKPVIDVERMLNGEGAKDGLKQVSAERLAADLGTGGSGRLDVSTAGSTVTLARQVPLSSEFGFKISDVEATGAGIVVTENGVPIENTEITFSAQPAPGGSVSVELENPDGSISKITLKATLSSPPGEGEFTIGGSTDDTAANFGTALGAEVLRVAKTDLSAASAAKAADGFFDTLGGKKAQRVDITSGGGTLATATGLRDATADDTIEWYQGYNAAIDPADPSTLPRSDATARVDSNIDVDYGVRANEDGLRLVVQSLALSAVASFDPAVATEADRYRGIIERSRDALAFDQDVQDPRDIHAEIAIAGKVATQASERHVVNKSATLELLDGIEGINKEEVVAQLLTLQTRMQASYSTTSILRQLSLVNYL